MSAVVGKGEFLLLDGSQGGSKDMPFEEGMTADMLFAKTHPGVDANKFNITINNLEVPGNQIIQVDDVIAFAPANVKGA